MDVTVAVCTHDRLELLAGLLESLGPATAGVDADVLIVDSASPEPVEPFLRSTTTAKPERLRVVRVDRPGISVARNTVLREARTPVVAFLDDDVRPRPGWLAALMPGFDDGDDVVAVGGRITLRWPDGAAPTWVSPWQEGWFSRFDLGDDEQDVGGGSFVPCANLAVRRADALEAGGFPEAMQRQPRRLMSGGEVFLQRRLRAGGLRTRYRPDAVVDHLVLRERVAPSWVLRRAYWQGRGEAAGDRVDRGRLPLSLVARRVGAHAVHRSASDLRRMVVGPRRRAAAVDFASTRSAGVGYAMEAVRASRAAGR
jgi:GT2 family glycosyltransferase